MTARALPEHVGADQPLRLEVAAALAYPDGSMTAAGLRKEAKRGNLAIERTAGKDYTTLADIADMRKRCRKEPKAQGSGQGQSGATSPAASPTPPSGSSSTEAPSEALSAALLTVAALSKPSPPTSRKSTSRPLRKATVIHLASR